MAKNDYRRSLIMLRAHERGYSGHVRLEHRVMMGSMYFTVSEKNASQGLCALLVRPDARGGYAAVKLGNLRRDGRGQSALAYSFDPRNIAGKPLDDYILIAITAISEGDCAIVLTGNVNGSRDFRFDGVREAVCAVCNPKAATNSRESPAAMPEATADDRENSDMPEAAADDRENSDMPEAAADERENSDISEEAATSDSENTAETETFEPEWNPPSEAMPEENPFVSACESCEMEIPADDLPEPTEDDFPAPNADSELQIVASTPWQGAAENIRTLFLSEEPEELMLGDGYSYVRAPMPEGSEFAFMNIGVKLENGAPAGIAYAFPGSYSAQPPEGLEDYVWNGGAADGWWVLYADPETGEKL